MTKDQRDSKRVAIDLKGSYRIWESEFPFAVLTIVNISHTGICFTTDDKVYGGDTVELKVRLSIEEEVYLLAKVVWSNKIYDEELFRTGVQIMNVNSDNVKKFKKYYEAKLLYPPKA